MYKSAVSEQIPAGFQHQSPQFNCSEITKVSPFAVSNRHSENSVSVNFVACTFTSFLFSLSSQTRLKSL